MNTPTNNLPDGRTVRPGIYPRLPSGHFGLRTTSGESIRLTEAEAREALGVTSGNDPVSISGWYHDFRFQWHAGRLSTSAIRVRDESGSYGLEADLKEAVDSVVTLGLQASVERCSGLRWAAIVAFAEPMCEEDSAALTEDQARAALFASRKSLDTEVRSFQKIDV